MNGWALGWRLAVRPSGAARARTALVILGFTFAVLILTLVLALLQAIHARADRTIAALPVFASSAASFHVKTFTLPYDNQPWTTTFVAADTAAAPPPPGLPRFPAPGETWLSPALQALLAVDPVVAQRIPGRRVGVIPASGLVWPDQLLAVVGSRRGSLNGSGASIGWGPRLPGDDSDTLLPAGVLWLVASTLIGIPLLFFALTVNRLSSTARARRTVALNLVGVPQEVLARAASVETGIQASIGSLLGITLGALLIPAISSTGLFGLTWFAVDTTPGPAEILLILLAVTLGAGRLGAMSVRRDAAASLSVRRDAPRTVGGLIRVVPLAVASSVLACFVLLGAVRPDHPLATTRLSILFVVAAGCAVGGALYALPWLTSAIAQRIVTSRSSIAILLAGRRLAHDASASARMSGGVLLLVVTSLLGLAVVTDLQSLVTDVPAGHTVDVLFPRNSPSSQISGAVTAAAAPVMALRLDLTEPTAGATATNVSEVLTIASCGDLAALAGPVSTAGGAACRNDAVYRVTPGNQGFADLNATERHHLPTTTVAALSAPKLIGSPLDGSTLIVTQDPSRWADLAAGGDLIALPGPGDAAADRFTTRILHSVPLADISYDDVDITSVYRLPIVRRLVFACTGLGLLAALATFLVAAGDRGRERRRETAGLIAVGTRFGILLMADVAQVVIAVAIALGLGLGVGWLIGDTYLTLAGHHGPFLAAPVLAIVLSGPALGITVLTAPLFTSGRVNAEDLHRA